jgi:hypothetical protein
MGPLGESGLVVFLYRVDAGEPQPIEGYLKVLLSDSLVVQSVTAYWGSVASSRRRCTMRKRSPSRVTA